MSQHGGDQTPPVWPWGISWQGQPRPQRLSHPQVTAHTPRGHLSLSPNLPLSFDAAPQNYHRPPSTSAPSLRGDPQRSPKSQRPPCSPSGHGHPLSGPPRPMWDHPLSPQGPPRSLPAGRPHPTGSPAPQQPLFPVPSRPARPRALPSPAPPPPRAPGSSPAAPARSMCRSLGPSAAGRLRAQSGGTAPRVLQTGAANGRGPEGGASGPGESYDWPQAAKGAGTTCPLRQPYSLRGEAGAGRWAGRRRGLGRERRRWRQRLSR